MQIITVKTTTITRFGALMLAAVCASVLAPASASAQSAEPYYRGKEITILIGSSAGGGYDAFARLIAAHW